MFYNYPLNVSFKLVSLGPQVSITDAGDSLVLYVKQKFLKLKEEVTVFSDSEQTNLLYYINADRILDFSARYMFTDRAGTALGSVKREGMKSLWRAHYNIFDGENQAFSIREESVATRFADGCFSQIPLLGIFSGYFFHPAFLVSRPDETLVMRVEKLPAFFEGRFKITKMAELEEGEEKQIILGILMMLLLERTRG